MGQQKIDLDALEAAMARATPGEWKWSISDKRVQVAAVRQHAKWWRDNHPEQAKAIRDRFNALRRKKR